MFWSPYACDTTGPLACWYCRNGYLCEFAEDRRARQRRTTVSSFARLFDTPRRHPPDGWWSEFDRIQPWNIVLRPDTWAHVARHVIHQMVSATVRRRQKRRAFVHAISAR